MCHKPQRMKKLATLLSLVPVMALAQTTHEVEVGGTLSNPNNLPYYDPMDITINVGDIVEWTNVGGTHNVYGQLDLFPDNPAGFGNGMAQQAPWTFSHTFTVPGVYDYHCTEEFQGNLHSTTQFGTITVLDPNSVTPVVGTTKAITLYPNPANDVLMVGLTGCTGITSIDILTVDGKLLRTAAVQDNRVNQVDLAGLPAGQYYVMMDRGRRTVLKPFVKS